MAEIKAKQVMEFGRSPVAGIMDAKRPWLPVMATWTRQWTGLREKGLPSCQEERPYRC